jgi:hypothetical protein
MATSLMTEQAVPYFLNWRQQLLSGFKTGKRGTVSQVCGKGWASPTGAGERGRTRFPRNCGAVSTYLPNSCVFTGGG